MWSKIDLTGKRFGLLVVVRKSDNTTKNHQHYWECKCDCGKTTNVNSYRLKSGKTKSCGCFMYENWKEGTALNTLNTKMYSTNTSGVKGVCWKSRDQKWEANIRFKGKFIYLGQYAKLEDAAKARKEAEEKYFVPILEKYGRLEEEKCTETKNSEEHYAQKNTGCRANESEKNVRL